MSTVHEQLLARASRYWPSFDEGPLAHETSPETVKRHELWDKELLGIGRWWSVIEGLEEQLPGLSVNDATATPDACFRCVIYPLKPLPSVHWVVVGCVSIIAPVCTVYGVQFEYPGESRRVTRRVELDCNQPPLSERSKVVSKHLTTALGIDLLPREIAETPIPLFVQWRKPPETTLFHALFTPEPDRLP